MKEAGFDLNDLLDESKDITNPSELIASILKEEHDSPTKNDSSVDEFAPMSAIVNQPARSESESDNPLSDPERAKKAIK